MRLVDKFLQWKSVKHPKFRAKMLPAFIFVLLLSCASAFAFEYNGSLCTSFIPQCNSYNFSLQNDFIFLEDRSIRLGPTFEIGWGIEKINRYGSNAFIYGYSLACGLKTQFRIIPQLFIDLDAKVNILYATFPTILWFDLDTGVSYYCTKHFFARATLGVLASTTEANFIGKLSCGIKY